MPAWLAGTTISYRVSAKNVSPPRIARTRTIWLPYAVILNRWPVVLVTVMLRASVRCEA